MVAALVVACGGGGGGGGDDDAVDGAVVAPCEMPPLAGEVVTLAGCGDPGGGDGPRGMARFANPVNVLVLPGGDVVVADFDNERLRVVGPDGGTRTLVAQAGFSRPFGLALAGTTLYVSTDDDDGGAHSTTTGTVWRVDTASGAAVVVAPRIGRPRGLLPLPDGRLVLSDYLHHTVSLLDPASGTVTLLAGVADHPGFADGSGGTARFDGPYGMSLLADGRIAIADLRNHRIRAVALDGTVSTLAGDGELGAVDGPATASRFGFPQALAGDGDRLFVTDTASFTIRLIEGGTVTTVAGSTGGWRDGAMRDAQFWGLEGLALSGDGGTLWVADGSRGEDLPYHRVRRVMLP